MKITLIGASGFVGSRLMNLLKESSYELLNIDKQQSRFFPEITVIANVLDQEALDRLLAGTDLVVLLAAEHRDDVTPTSLYYDVNVGGMRNTLSAMEKNGVKRLVFFSSVAIYGMNKPNPDEDFPADPFNHYGKSKWQAEQVLQAWYPAHPDWNINILRPTVIFGERNRGNVYNLLHQIAGGRFLMVGKGDNVKSMAYVGNVVAFVKHLIENQMEGYNVFNYVDKPDFSMNELIPLVSRVLGRKIPMIHFPYWLGMAGGYCFDALAFVLRKKLSVSSIRVKKFCSTTQFASVKAHEHFQAPYTLADGLSRTLEYEFLHPAQDDVIFYSE
ncbi:MAG: NAD-dependent epimerase/dehydratase family protein [Bacteroidales bacterium]|nr:NAD-dependent epimerase/dehydratase family protein [Bacteroidales bacterium]